MLTGQNYAPGNPGARPSVGTVETDQSPLVTSDDRQAYQTGYCHWPTVFLDQLVKFGNLTQEQRERAFLIDIPDNSMDYPLLPGGQICIVFQERASYPTVTGVVFMDLTDGSSALGRIESINETHLVLKRENPEWPILTLAFDQIADLYVATHFTNIEVR